MVVDPSAGLVQGPGDKGRSVGALPFLGAHRPSSFLERGGTEGINGRERPQARTKPPLDSSFSPLNNLLRAPALQHLCPELSGPGLP